MYSHPLLVSPTASRPIPALLRTPASAKRDDTRPKILVPVDGSRTSEAAVEHVVALARSMPLEVHLLNVQSPVMAGDVNVFTTAPAVRSRRRTAGDEVLKRARSILAAARIEHTTEVAFGDPAPAIVRSAAVNECDKIVMATRNSGLLHALLRPSVARRVVKLSPIPVTVVKAAALSDATAASGAALAIAEAS